MPSLSSVVQRLLVSTINDWEMISKWYWKLSLPHLNKVTPDMEAKVIALTSNDTTNIEKVESLFYFVAQQIRYMGLTTEKDAPGYEPHDVDITYNNKYGVCRDKAALLVSLLTTAGFKAYPVLINAGPKLDIEVPLIHFNHAIACVELTPGNYTLMDPTDENTKQLLPPYLCNKSYLVAKPNGDTLRTTPIIPANKNLMRIKTSAKIDSNGTLKAKVHLNFDGINDNAYRGHFARLNNMQRKLFFEKILKNIIPSAELVNLTLTPKNMQNTEIPLTALVEYEADEILIRNDKTALFPVPWFGKTIGIINYVIRETGLDKRKYPLDTNTTCGYEENMIVDFSPDDFKSVLIPKYKSVDDKIISYNQVLNYKSNTLSGKNIFKLKVVELSPKQYLDFKKILKELEINEKKMPILSVINKDKSVQTNPSTTINARILNKEIKLDIINQSNWTETFSIKTKILNYEGKKQNSEIKISYNPTWETLEIETAQVTSSDGKLQKASKEEINTMDAPWTGSAPRYPSEKILVINLPGVKIGSIIDLKIIRKMKNRPFFSKIFNFKTSNPIDRYNLKITFPKDLKLKLIPKNLSYINKIVIDDFETTTYEWNVNNLREIKKELYQPPTWVFMPSLFISTGNWASYSNFLNLQLINASLGDTKLKSSTKQLMGTEKIPANKIISIRDFVSKNIRPIGPSFVDMPLSEFTPVTQTISDGYGNNADSAIVLYSLLSLAGFYPEFVLASNYPDIKQIVNPMLNAPQFTFFNKVLVKVTNSKDKPIYLNDTNEYSALGSTANEYNIGLNLRTGKTEIIKPLKNKNSKIEFDYKIKLDNSGNAAFVITKKYYGLYFGIYNKKFTDFRPEQRNRYFQKIVSDVSQNATPVGKLETDFSNYPGQEKFSIKIDNYAIIDNGYYHFKTPLDLNKIFLTGKKNRFYPYFMNLRTNISYNIEASLPSEYTKKIIIPNTETISFPNNSGDIQFDHITDVGKNIWKEMVSFKCKPSIFTTEQYDAILTIDKEISQPITHTILLKK